MPRRSIEDEVKKLLNENTHLTYPEACRYVIKRRDKTKREKYIKKADNKKKKRPKTSVWTVPGGKVSPK